MSLPNMSADRMATILSDCPLQTEPVFSNFLRIWSMTNPENPFC